MIHEVPASSPDFSRVAELRNFQFGKSVERRVEHYSRRSPSSQLVLNINRHGQVTSSGLASSRADLILTVWLGSNDLGRQSLSGTVLSNNNDRGVIRRVVIRKPTQTRAEFALELLKELGKEIRSNADKQLNSAFEGEVIA